MIVSSGYDFCWLIRAATERHNIKLEAEMFELRSNDFLQIFYTQGKLFTEIFWFPPLSPKLLEIYCTLWSVTFAEKPFNCIRL